MKKSLLPILLIAASLPAFASVTIGDINYSDSLEKDNAVLKLNGAGLREIFFVDVYAAGLYLPQITSDAKAVINMPGNKCVRLGLLRDVDAGDFVDALKDGINDNTTEEERKSLDTELQSLIAVMDLIGDVKKGDIVDFDYTKFRGTSITVNGQLIGEKIGGEKLYEAVLKIWLGDKAIDNGLKASLLKK